MLNNAQTFSGMELDRAGTLRKDARWVSDRLRDPASRFVAANATGVVLGGDPPALVRYPLGGLTDVELDTGGAILLGVEQGSALFALDLEGVPAETASDLTAAARVDGPTAAARVAGLRDAGSLLGRSEAGLAAYLTAMLNWHRRHRFCANCGAATVSAEAGYSRLCGSCGAEHFPRTDPAVIVLVECDGHILLGRHANWPARQYSVLAGFVSPGESLEEAVIREVEEESGIIVLDPTFVASQPWPFPSSLMLGFQARSEGGDPTAKDGELEDVAWFSRDQVSAAVAGRSSELRLPPSVSIASYLVRRWCRSGELSARSEHHRVSGAKRSC